jgi:hypothetical protein
MSILTRLTPEQEDILEGHAGLVSDFESACERIAVLNKKLSASIETELVMRTMHTLKTEINCRREHGAEGSHHLLYIENRIMEIMSKLSRWKR